MRKSHHVKKKRTFKKLFVFIIFIIAGALGYFGFWYYDNIYLDKINTPKIFLNGKKNIILNYGEKYDDEGAKALFRDENLSKKIDVKNNIDYDHIGKYEIVYTIKRKDKSSSVKRTIEIVDKVAPVIKLKGDANVTAYLDEEYIDKGVTVSDNYDKDLDSKVLIDGNVNVNEEGEYTLKYSVSDSSGNSAEVVRLVTVKERPLVHKNGVAVLNYHFFYRNGERCSGGTNCILDTAFEEQLQYLVDNGYKTLTMEEFRAWIYGEISVPEKSVLITIDDGAMGTSKVNGNVLIPLLEKYQVHATLFLVTGWWSIDNYRSSYLDVESHSNDLHTEKYCSGVSRGAQMLCLDYDTVLADLKQSINVTGSTTAYCYPFYVYNDLAIQEVKDAGFKLAFAGGGYKATRNSNKYAIPRFQITKNTSLKSFIRMIY